jgi:hypothetical protein
MIDSKFRVIGIILAGVLVAPTALAAQYSDPEVVLIVGTGFSPNNLKEGSRPKKGTEIKADSKTIVVLQRTWPIKNGRCEDWVILRGSRYKVENATPKNCPKRGNGDEVARAMNGESIKAHLTLSVLAIDNPKADNYSASSKELQILESDLTKLRDSGKDALKPLKLPSSRGQIQARYHKSQCLHKKYNNWNNGNPIHLWSCAAGSNTMKKWNYDPNTGYIRSVANRKMCWHKKFANWTNGNPIHLWNCSAGLAANKTWSYEANNGLIRARGNPRKCIHKKHGGFGNGNPVHLWDCNSGQREFKSWRLR